MELFVFVFPFLTFQSLSAFDWPLPDNPRYQTVMPHNDHRYWPPEVISDHRYWPPPQQPNPAPPDPLPPSHRVNVRPSSVNNRNHRPSVHRDSPSDPSANSGAIGGGDRYRSSQSSDHRFRSHEPSSPVRHVPYDEPYHHPMDHYQPSERVTEPSFHATEVPMSSVYEPKESPSYSQPNERVKPHQSFRQSANHVRVKERVPATNFQFDPPPPTSQESPPKELHHYGHDVFNDPRDQAEDAHHSRDEMTNNREHSSPKNNLPLQVDKEAEEEALRREEELRRREEERIKEEKRIKEEADRIREETRRRDENRRREEERRRRDEERRKIEELRRREEKRMREEEEAKLREEIRKEEEEEKLKREEEERLKRDEKKKEKERLLSREQPSDESSDYDRPNEGDDHRNQEEGDQSWPSPKPPQPVTEAPKVEPVTRSYRPRPVSRPRGARYGRRRMSTARTTTTTTTTPAPLQPAESDQPEYYDDDDDEYYDYQPTTTTRRPRRRRPKGGRRRMTPPEPTSSTTPSTTTKKTTLSPGYRDRPDGRIIDFRADPNYPYELKGFDLTEYPFYIQIPDGIKFKCDGRHDGYYANIEHHCQVRHSIQENSSYVFIFYLNETSIKP